MYFNKLINSDINYMISFFLNFAVSDFKAMRGQYDNFQTQKRSQDCIL